METISVVGYSDVGSQTGQDLTELSIGLKHRNLLNHIYCRGVEKRVVPNDFITTPIPLGRTIPRAMTGINQFLMEDFNNRYYSERIFDFFASKSISNSGIHLHHTPGYIRTLREGNKNGNKTVVKATTEYTDSFYQRVLNESEKIEISSPKFP
ncbi:hypothetical protein, partial [Halolamina salina]